MTTVAVFGANGATGGEVVKACIARGHDVVAVVRRPETIAEGTRTAKVDLAVQASLVAALSGVGVKGVGSGHGHRGWRREAGW
jgi:uncharacterized protein YbjT (DUF2867 family)